MEKSCCSPDRNTRPETSFDRCSRPRFFRRQKGILKKKIRIEQYYLIEVRDATQPEYEPDERITNRGQTIEKGLFSPSGLLSTSYSLSLLCFFDTTLDAAGNFV